MQKKTTSFLLAFTGYLSNRNEVFDKIKQNFFQTSAVLTIPYGCTTWTLTKCMEKMLERQINDPIYPTPPLGQDMTQGQFLSGV